jgi:hypothetical protein
MDLTIKDFEKLGEFRKVIEKTIQSLEPIRQPHQLTIQIDQLLEIWDKTDDQFAGVLREVRNQAYSMKPEHLVAVVNKLCEHLKVNLESVNSKLK